ncbi:MAG: thioredoxin-disulfide reductase [Candidatus Omnitrophota bacterium]
MYDVVIIGAGPAGLTACLYALRSRLNVLLVEKMQVGGGLGYIEKLENYPGFPEGINGLEFAGAIQNQLKKYDFKFTQKEIKSIKQDSDLLFNLDAEGENIITKAVIIATGATPKKLGIPGEERFAGKGVSYCAVCDAPFFKDKEIVVIGGGNTALEESLYLTKFASRVTIVHRRNAFRADKIVQERVHKNEKIELVLDAVCDEIQGETFVAGTKLKFKDGREKLIPCSGVFIFAGMKPETGFLEGLLEVDESGQIITDEKMQSSVKGVFVCGDCRRVPLRQVITACGEGAIAAYSAGKYIEEF